MLGASEYPIYLVRDQGEAAVFEGGVGAMGPLLQQQIERLGIDAGFVKQIIVTHAHPDHVMAVPMFRKIFTAATVSASKAAAGTMSAERAVSFFAKVDQGLTGSLLAAGSIGEEHRPEPLAVMQIAVDRLLAGGDTVAVGSMSFDVLETPGHSDCSLSFHEPTAGILVISDATGYYLPDHEWWWPNYFTGYGAYLDSMQRLSALSAKVLCLSHNAAVTGTDGVKAYFDGAIAATEAYHRRIVGEAKEGKDAREIAEQLGREVHEKTQLMPLDFFQKNCGLLVKQSMKHEGMIDE
jgi:glyoxylase-like metal-dependent hydrolase (beta-lactamase superfamily II)